MQIRRLDSDNLNRATLEHSLLRLIFTKNDFSGVQSQSIVEIYMYGSTKYDAIPQISI